MGGASSQEPAGQLGPFRQGLAALHELRVGPRQLPRTADPTAGLGFERHALDVLRSRLVVVKAGGRGDRVAVGLVPAYVVDTLAFEIDRASVLNGADVIRAVLDGTPDIVGAEHGDILGCVAVVVRPRPRRHRGRRGADAWQRPP